MAFPLDNALPLIWPCRGAHRYHLNAASIERRQGSRDDLWAKVMDNDDRLYHPNGGHGAAGGGAAGCRCWSILIRSTRWR